MEKTILNYMTIIHVLEPLAAGIISAILTITQQLDEMQHIVVHGLRTGSDTREAVKEKFPKNVQFIPWPSAGREIDLWKDLRALRELLSILRPWRNEKKGNLVIHLHSSKAGFIGRAACGILRIMPVLYTPHGASFIRTDIGKFKKDVYRFLEKTGGLFGGTVTGCGPSEGDLYSAIGRPALWVANGVEISPLVKDGDPRLVTFTGRAEIQKDPEFFNRVAMSFAGREARFCWVGDGPLREELRSANITVTGWADKKSLDGYLSRTLIFFSTAAWEGLPYGALEAMNAACALLLRNVPGNRELVSPGENGYLFDSVEEAATLLTKMLENRSMTLAMGVKSRALAEKNYSAELMGKKYRELYHATASGDIYAFRGAA